LAIPRDAENVTQQELAASLGKLQGFVVEYEAVSAEPTSMWSNSY
jgi:hypothetical protein